MGRVTKVKKSKLQGYWSLYALHRINEGNGKKYFVHIGSKRWVDLHLLKEKAVRVKVTEDKRGEYWGWLDKNDDKPSMIWPNEIKYTMCFPYGPEAEEARGKGKTIRMNIVKSEK